jgi:hypothetical protein
MTNTQYKIEPTETADKFGNVTLAYDVWKVDPAGYVQTVCVCRTLTGYQAIIIFRSPINPWSVDVPEGQWGPALSTLRDKLDEFDCPYFEIAEPQRRF